MPTNIRVIDDAFLQTKNLGRLGLEFLNPDHKNYTYLAIQPRGTVTATRDGLAVDGDDFENKLRESLKLAVAQEPDLVLAPEYSFSWSVLGSALTEGHRPTTRTLWVLGCQSITWEQFQAFVSKHPEIAWIYEQPDLRNKRFLNPVVYLFRTVDGSESGRLVAVVQFKTMNCGDGKLHLERDNLALGNELYIIRKDENSLRLATFACSDAFNSEAVRYVADQIHAPYIFLHLQLNDEPRHLDYSDYRRAFFRRGNNQKEVLTLNWARGTKIVVPERNTEYSYNLTYSAHYTKSTELNLTDERFVENHDRGLYVSRWPKHHAQIYVLNFDEYIFEIESTKPSQDASINPIRQRTGPRALHTYKWKNGTWQVSELPIDDGFKASLTVCQINCPALENLKSIQVERIIYLANALRPGPAATPWHHYHNFQPCLSTEEELIQRYTFTHDNDPRAEYDRRAALDVFANLLRIVASPAHFPAVLNVAGLDWVPYSDSTNRSFNFYRADKTSGMLFAFAGTAGTATLREIRASLWDALGPNDKHRLVIWYYEGPNLLWFHQAPDITLDTSDAATSIARETII